MSWRFEQGTALHSDGFRASDVAVPGVTMGLRVLFLRSAHRPKALPRRERDGYTGHRREGRAGLDGPAR